MGFFGAVFCIIMVIYFFSENFMVTSAPIASSRAFSTIGLLGRTGKKSVATTLCELTRLLLAERYALVANDETAKIIASSSACECLSDITVVENHAMTQSCDLLIVVGGDGSILQAVDVVIGQGDGRQSDYKKDTPILGINRGRLGFLADVHPDELSEKVLSVLSGAYERDERFLLSMEIYEGDTLIHKDVALNDVVLHAGKSVHTIDFQLWIDGMDVYRQHADGLIIATPTGSTAYNLSAGGPIIHPSLSAICLAPMHPHTLSSRPILVGDSRVIELKVHKDNRTQPHVSADGKSSIPLYANQVLRVTKHPKRLSLIHPVGYDFYEACRTKLNWNLYSEEFSLSDDF